MKKVFILIAAITFSISVFAGGILTNTNQSTRFLRNPARGASTEIDAIFSNPAGLSFMKEDGFYISVNNQMAFQTRTVTSTFAPFALNGGSDTKKYKGTAQSFFIPSIQAAYKWKNWVFSASFAIVGGGGTLDFKKGLPSFEAGLVGNLMTPLTQLNDAAAKSGYTGDPATLLGYSLDMRLKGSSINYGTQIGVNYKVINMISFFAGARFAVVRNGYDGYLRNINAKISNANALATHFTNAAAYLESLGEIEQAEALKGAAYGISNFEAGASQKNLALKNKQAGWGVTPILGVDFNYKNLNIGVKYEFNTKITLKNKTKENTTGIADFNDGVKTRSDIPALFGVGASYKFLKEKLIVSLGYHLFLDKKAKMLNDKQKLKKNSHEVMLGLEYVINDKFLVSTGAQITRLGLTEEFQSDMSFYCNSFSIGIGGAYTIIKNLTLNLAYLYTNYDKFTNNKPAYPGKEVYTRTSHTIGIGLDYHF
ncbi:MAG: porin family protein [Bacteroidales bacterium]|nr:porin family protein [Bacteroidales bacterium]